MLKAQNLSWLQTNENTTYHSVHQGCILPEITFEISEPATVSFVLAVILLQFGDIVFRPLRPQVYTILDTIVIPL